MEALIYLMRKRWKNRLRLMVKNKATLVFIIFMLALLIFSFWSSGQNQTNATADSYRSISELHAIIAALYALIFLMGIYKGFNTGASMFSMSDVNLLFTSPVSSKKILFYGLIEQLGINLLIAVYLLFQYSWLNQTYGITMFMMICYILGYALVIFASNIVAMIIYMLTSHNEQKKRIIKTAVTVVCSAEVIYIVIYCTGNMQQLAGQAVAVLNTLPVTLFPVAGWTKAAVTSIAAGELMTGILFLAAVCLFTVALIVIMVNINADFYEDVLASAEYTYTVRAAQKEGKTAETTRRRIKLKQKGLNSGWGAKVIFVKHKLEASRSSLFLLDTQNFIFIASILIVAWFTREIGMVTALIVSVYMQIFLISSGRWVKEVMKPYICMIPESSFKKLIWYIAQSIYVYFIEAVILAVGLVLILQTDPVMLIAFILFRFSFSLLMTSANLLGDKLFGEMTVKMLVMIFYLISVIVLSIPGLVAGFAGMFMPVTLFNIEFMFLLFESVINVLVALAVTYACRNILTDVEFNH